MLWDVRSDEYEVDKEWNQLYGFLKETRNGQKAKKGQEAWNGRWTAQKEKPQVAAKSDTPEGVSICSEGIGRCPRS